MSHKEIRPQRHGDTERTPCRNLPPSPPEGVGGEPRIRGFSVPLCLCGSLALFALLAVGCSSSKKKQESKTGPLEQAHQMYKQGNYDAAISECDKAIAAGDRVAAAYLLRGKCQEKKGAETAAIADYGQARAHDPKLAEAYCREARLQAHGLHITEAKAVLAAAEPVRGSLGSRDQFYLLATQGEVHMAAGEAEQARETLKAAVEMADAGKFQDGKIVAVACYNLSQAHFQLGAFRPARAAYERYLEIKKQSGEECTADDNYTEVVLRMLTGDVRGAQALAADLPIDKRRQAEALLVGDRLSVKELVDEKERR